MGKIVKNQDKSIAIAAMLFGLAGLVCCIVSLGLSVTDSIYAKFFLAFALVLVGLNRICLHITKHKGSMIYEIIITCLMFILALLVALSSYGIYFLTVSFFLNSILISINRVLMIKEDHSVQSIVLNTLVIAFSVIYSFIFLFPAIYQKHATSVSNSNFIILSYTVIVLFTCIKNALIPARKKLKLDRAEKIISRTLTLEILMGLCLLVTLCSIYFTLVEPGMESFVDSLWYSFSVITTIGFGDVSVTTTFGRMLSVILGIYGIVVVGLVTSIIVSIYNDFYRKKEEHILERLEQKEDEIDKIVEEQKEKENKESDKK